MSEARDHFVQLEQRAVEIGIALGALPQNAMSRMKAENERVFGVTRVSVDILSDVGAFRLHWRDHRNYSTEKEYPLSYLWAPDEESLMRENVRVERIGKEFADIFADIFDL